MATVNKKRGRSKPRSKPKGKRVDVYQAITVQIIEALEAGVVPWHRPWKLSEGPLSLSTLRPYRGVNVFVLLATAALNGYTSPWWGTYKQIKERGGQVRKGEHGTMIVYWERREPDEADGATEPDGKKDRPTMFLRYFKVFNADQADNLETPELEPLPEVNPIDSCEQIVGDYLVNGGPSLRHGGDRAYYNVTKDHVQMPNHAQFESAEAYYRALFHEMGHSSGAEKRLNRPELVAATVFGDPDYSREELTADMTAAFLCGEAAIDVNVEAHASYLQGWLWTLGNDPRLVVQAGGAAQKAADLILGVEVEEAT